MSITTSALIDTGANGLTFINSSFAIGIARRLGLRMRRLPKPITVRAYDGKIGSSITYLIELDLFLDGRKL